MSTVAQRYLEKVQKEHSGLVCGAAMQLSKKQLLMLRYFPIKEMNAETIEAFAYDALVQFNAKRSEISCLTQLTHFIELIMVHKDIAFLFLAKKDSINTFLMKRIATDFCEKVYSDLHAESIEQLKAAELKVATKILRNQDFMLVKKQVINGNTCLIHEVKTEYTGKLGTPEALNKRRLLLNEMDHKLVLSDFQIEGDKLVFTRPYIAATSVAQLIKNKKKLSPKQSLVMISNILNILKPLHEKGLAHGNLHPNNIYFSAGKFILIDDYLFDVLSLDSFTRKAFHKYGRLPVGHLGFISPEQLLGQKPSPQSDFWALGFLLSYLILGKPVLQFKTPREQLVAAHFTLQKTIEEKVVPESPFLKELFEKLIQDQVGKRFKSHKELVSSIQSVRRSVR